MLAMRYNKTIRGYLSCIYTALYASICDCSLRRTAILLKKKHPWVSIMDNLNLDVDTYSPDDLKRLFTLRDGYKSTDVDREKSKLLAQLTAMSSIKAEKRMQINFFIDSAASRLKAFGGKKDDGEGTWMQKYNTTIEEGSHVIIENPNVAAGRKASMTDGRLAGGDNLPAGYLNPINVRSIARGLNIDSRFRENYYSTASHDFVVNIPDPYRKVTTLRIGTIDMPMTMYSVTRANGDSGFIIKSTGNRVSLTGKTLYTIEKPSEPTLVTIPADLEGEQAWFVVIPDGNYEIEWQGNSNAEDIVVAINNAIALALSGYMDTSGRFLLDPTGPKLDPTRDVCYSVDRASGRSIFATPSTISGGSTITYPFELVFGVDHAGTLELGTTLQLKLGWKLGFRAGVYVSNNSTQGDIGSAVTSEGICLVSPPRYVFIAIDDGQKSQGTNLLAAFTQSSLDSNIMTRVNCAATMDSTGVFKCASDAGLSNQLNRTREYFGPVDIARLHIQLLDEYGRPVSLNYMDWSMTLVFDQLYD